MIRKGIQSSISGEINKIFLVFSRNTNFNFLSFLEDFFSSKPNSAQLFVWTVDNNLSICLREFLFDKGIEFSSDPNNFNKDVIITLPKSNDILSRDFSIWVRDGFIVLKEEIWHNLIGFNLTVKITNRDDFGFIHHLESNGLVSGIKIPKYKFVIEGGDILADDDFVLIGGRSFDRYANQFPGNNSKKISSAKLALSILFGLEVGKIFVILSELIIRLQEGFLEARLEFAKILFSKKAWFPDVVGDEGDGDRVFDDLVHIDVFMNLTGVKKDGKPIIFVGKVFRLYSLTSASINRLNLALDAVVEELSGSFEVIRTPIPFIDSRTTKVHVLYNNSLVEKVGESCKVWIPSAKNSSIANF